MVASGDGGVVDGRFDLYRSDFFHKRGRTIFSRFLHSGSICVKTLTVHSGGWDCGRLFYLYFAVIVSALKKKISGVNESLFTSLRHLGMLLLGVKMDPGECSSRDQAISISWHQFTCMSEQWKQVDAVECTALPHGLLLHMCHTHCPESIELVWPVASTGCSALASLMPFPILPPWRVRVTFLLCSFDSPWPLWHGIGHGI